jgi:DNA-binding LytR/AlgR family response regulator
MVAQQHRKVLVVEDEAFIAEMLRTMLEDMGHEVVATALDVASAEQAFDEHEFNFAIFDINIEGGMEGIDLAKRAAEINVPFMFLTSYTDRSTIDKAKLTKPGAYVLKPFNEEDVFAGMEMALMHAMGGESEVIPLKVGHRTVLVQPANILYLKADNIYVEVVTAEKKHLVRQSLTGFLEEHPRDQLLRVHRSFAVNLDQVDTVARNYVEVAGQQIPVSKSYREQLANRMN